MGTPSQETARTSQRRHPSPALLAAYRGDLRQLDQALHMGQATDAGQLSVENPES